MVIYSHRGGGKEPRPKLKIEQLTKGYESYERDEFTGEILSGGNTFVFANYAYGLTA